MLISPAGLPSRYPPVHPAAADHDPGPAQVAEDRLQELLRDVLGLRYLLGAGVRVGLGSQFGDGSDGIVGSG